MLTASQHAIRDAGIGSSDAAAACNLSPWKSRVDLWLEKTKRIEQEDISGKPLVHFGIVLEQVVADEFVRQSGRRVRNVEKPYVRGLMVSNIDRLILAGNGRETGILECKTADKYSQGKWDEVPLHYQIQVHHQLVCAKKREAVLAVLIGGNSYRDFEIDFDQTIADELIGLEMEFWTHVELDTPPPALSSSDVLALYDADPNKVIIATPELVELHEELMAVRLEYKSIEQRKEEIEEVIKVFMGPAEFIMDPATLTTPLVTWKQIKSGSVTNWENAFGILRSQYLKMVEGELVGVTTDPAVAELAATTSKKRSRQFLPKERKA